jgi:hypothetical protein
MSEKESIAEVRKRAWQTRRAKYGSRGHAGAYGGFRPIYAATWNVRLRMMEDALIRLYRQSVLSEGQTCKATGMDRVTVREMAIQQAEKESRV